MASCQQIKTPICGNCSCWKREVRPDEQGQIDRVSCMAYPNKDLGIENGRPALVSHNPVEPTQIWVKIETPNNNDNDQLKPPGPIPFPRVFVLVSTATGQALCDKDNEVVLTDYKSGSNEKSLLWTEEGGYIIGAHGKVWTAEGVQGNKITLRTPNGQANQLWNTRNIFPTE
ncbi:hypothetical protein SUGI_1133790 [Cryptomeria japonica]|uniref:uncharacterized protein LOC131036952 n=1 Tax=Cryptomeria japonica TaxID=3369 RepID=UPI00241492B4|nr:uncharacterized protein LOC131036952 [Cryptomeria japonica]GLJ53196.1 hypothetical protein SUGI_1133790 [Cryptomeria japonica]